MSENEIGKITGNDPAGTHVIFQNKEYISHGNGLYEARERPGMLWVWIEHPQHGGTIYNPDLAIIEGYWVPPPDWVPQSKPLAAKVEAKMKELGLKKDAPAPASAPTTAPAPQTPKPATTAITPAKPKAPTITIRKGTKAPLAPPSTHGVKTAREEYEKFAGITKNDFYSVGRGKTHPSAKALQVWANELRISTEIVDVGKDDRHAWAKVRGWIGPKDAPMIMKEEYVAIYFDEFEQLDIIDRMDRYQKQGGDPAKIVKMEGGRLILLNPRMQLEHFKYCLRKRVFAERTCITKAEARINRKLLSMEWRDDAEIEEEMREIEEVDKMRSQEGK